MVEVRESTILDHRTKGFGRWTLPSILFMVAIAGLLAGFAFIRKSGPDAIFKNGKASLLQGNRESVERAAEQLLKIPGYEFHAALLHGLMLARTGKIAPAISKLHEAAENPLLMVEANTAIARCYYESGRYLETIHAASVALQKDPHSLEARRWLASAYYDLGAVAQASAELEQISNEAPDDPRPDRLLGLMAKDSEQFQKAVDHYRKSLKRAPRQKDAEALLVELAESLIKLDRFAEATEVLESCPRSPTTLTLQSTCQASLGQFEEADRLLNDALKLDPRNVAAKLALGKRLLDRGQPEEASQVLAEAVHLEPYNRQLHFQLSQALREIGKTAEADEELNRMLEIQRWETEFSELHDRAANDPNDAAIRFRIGQLADLLGKSELAKVWFRAALALDPYHAEAQAALKASAVPSGRR
jgi:tetratricopeptide (TPR) repeat protein